jgi:DNA-binding MarR family transcriptional regulator
MSVPATPAFAFREHPVQIPAWFMGILNKYVPAAYRANALQDYAVAHASQHKPLTVRQHQIYDFLASYYASHNYAPSLEEIAQEFGFQSLSTVVEHLQNLARKGWIIRFPNETRGILLAETPR